MEPDVEDLRAEADAALEGAAERLRGLLREAVARLQSFPPFPGAFFTYGIEVEAPGVESPERGCVVLAPDGELYELQIGEDLEAMALGWTDPISTRKEELKELDLHPREYLIYAYNALMKVLDLLRRQAGG